MVPVSDSSPAEVATAGAAAPDEQRGAPKHPEHKLPGVPNPAPNAPPYPGDYRGPINAQYEPVLDGDADPGEVVWGWVPFEDDPTRGKDRPVLVIGRDGQWVLALQLTTADHRRDYKQEANEGRYWTDIGVGPWDKSGRNNDVRVNRVIRLDPFAIRREGAIMEPDLFYRVIAAMGQVPPEHSSL